MGCVEGDGEQKEGGEKQGGMKKCFAQPRKRTKKGHGCKRDGNREDKVTQYGGKASARDVPSRESLTSYHSSPPC